MILIYIFRKKRGEEDAFGVTSAIDQMSFAQDIIMMDDPKVPVGGPLVMDITKGGIQSTQPVVAVVPLSTVPVVPTVASSITAQSTIRAPSTTTSTPSKMIIPEKTFSDPLRDLILLSEVILIDDEEEYLQNIKFYAEDSSCLEHVLEVNSKGKKLTQNYD